MNFSQIGDASRQQMRTVLKVGNESFKVVLQSDVGTAIADSYYEIPWHTFLPLQNTNTYKIETTMTLLGLNNTSEDIIFHVCVNMGADNTYSNSRNANVRHLLGTGVMSAGVTFAFANTRLADITVHNPTNSINVKVLPEDFSTNTDVLSTITNDDIKDIFQYYLTFVITPIF